MDTNNDNDIIEAEFTEENLPSTKGDNLPSTEVKITEVDIEFEYARRNIIKILETSDAVLESTAELVLDTEHPRMIEVYSGLIRNLTDINKSIFEIREKKMKIKGELAETKEVTEQTVNNNSVFIGSSEEVLEMMKA